MSPARYAWRGSLFWVADPHRARCVRGLAGVSCPRFGLRTSFPAFLMAFAGHCCVPVLAVLGCARSCRLDRHPFVGALEGGPVTIGWLIRPFCHAVGHFSQGASLCPRAICVPMSALPGVVLFAPRSSVSLSVARVRPLRWLVHREPGCGIAAVRMLAFARRRSLQLGRNYSRAHVQGVCRESRPPYDARDPQAVLRSIWRSGGRDHSRARRGRAAARIRDRTFP